MLQRVIYVSRVRDDVSAVSIERIVGSARVWNRRHDITGWLCCTGRHFIQVLEGNEDALRQCLERIWRDPNHEQRRLMQVRPLQRRSFDEWDMGYVRSLDLEDSVAELFEAPRAAVAEATEAVHDLLVRASHSEREGRPLSFSREGALGLHASLG